MYFLVIINIFTKEVYLFSSLILYIKYFFMEIFKHRKRSNNIINSYIYHWVSLIPNIFPSLFFLTSFLIFFEIFKSNFQTLYFHPE